MVVKKIIKREVRERPFGNKIRSDVSACSFHWALGK
jgi:hypothetical protein